MSADPPTRDGEKGSMTAMQDDLASAGERCVLIQPDKLVRAEQCDHPYISELGEQDVDKLKSNSSPAPVRVHHHIVDVGMESVIGDASGEADQARTHPRANRRAGAEDVGIVVLASLREPPNGLMECIQGVRRDASGSCGYNLDAHAT